MKTGKTRAERPSRPRLPTEIELMQSPKTQELLARLRTQHRALDAAVGQLSARTWLSVEDQARATDLKKRRLRARDRMRRIAEQPSD